MYRTKMNKSAFRIPEWQKIDYRYNAVDLIRYCTKGGKCDRMSTHKQYLIPRSHGQAMGCFCEYFKEKL